MNSNISNTENQAWLKRLGNNIYKNYIYTFMSNFNVTSGVWMLYLAYRGLSLFEIGIMEAIFHLTSFTMEVPTGVVADLLGRKMSRIMGRFMAVIATLLMIYAGGPLGFAISFVFSALSYNLESGAGDALIYDSMKEIGSDKTYMKVKGRGEALFQIANAMALPIGGYLATTNYQSVYKLAFVVGIVTLIHSFSFVEPNVGKVEKKDNHLTTFKHQLKDSISIVKNSKDLGFLIIMAESYGVFATTTFFYIQNFLKEGGKSEFRIGLVLAIGSVLAAIMATAAHRIEKRFGFKITLTVLLMAGSSSLWLMATGALAEIGIVLLSIFEVIEFVVMSDYINKLIPSERRATILSMESMVFSLFMIIIFPIVGLVGDLWGLQMSFILIAGLSTIVSGLMVRRIHMNKGVKPSEEE